MKKWLAYLVSALMVLASVVHAQTSAQDGQRTYTQQGTLIGGLADADSTLHVLKMDATGNAKVSVQNANASLGRVLNGGAAAINDTTALGMADSSAVITVSDILHSALFIKCTGSGGKVTLAISVRFHLNGLSDTSSVAVIPFRVTTYGTGAASPDSIRIGFQNVPTAAARGDGELLVETNDLTLAAGKWIQGSQCAYVPLGNLLAGAPIYATAISIRERVIAITGSKVPLVTVYLIGSPL